ncbi:peptidoglycan DD-metalloendopeptidase family protein [Bacillus marinisedimentorum]|uniref:peptidoglycan DD-metalloendopeptidase family protein n=1 Tax=Bacillus marinisedimentorum TaxID=1821260 RepID=UPI003CCC157B
MAATGETLRYGSRGQAVESLQQTLSRKGYYNSSVDGIFGSITKSAVISFQRSHGLVTDGIVGPNTYAALSGMQTVVKGASTTTENFIMPTQGVLTSDVGSRWNSYHAGIDISQHGTVKVIAAASGVVERSYYSSSYGNVIFISHTINGQKYTTVYAHLRDRLVSEGQRVTQGQSIGHQGNTGNSNGQHLHFELHKGDWNQNKTNAVNPLDYLN